MSMYWKDLAERVAASYLGGMVAAMGVTGDIDLTDGKVWIGGALAGAFSVVKGLAAYFTDRTTASVVDTRP